MFNEMARFAGSVMGSVVGVTAVTIAAALSIPVAAVEAARSAGCNTYGEIKEYFDDVWS